MKFRSLALAAALAVGASGAWATQVTLTGLSFSVTYDDALVGLFGTPTLTGNVLSWFPSGSPGFSAQSADGIDVTNSTFALKVMANNGYTLTSFGLTEGGDYFSFGSGLVAVSGQLRVTPLPGITTATDNIDVAAPFIVNTGFDATTHNWSAQASTGVAAGTTLANVTVQNILLAYAEAAAAGPDYAFIEKKEAFLTIGVSPVPEPETYALMAAGLGVVGFLSMRRRREDQ